MSLFLVACLAGFIFPLSFALAALLGAGLYYDIFGLPFRDGQQENLIHLTQDDDWLDAYCSACDSPAETAFLTAMVQAFALTPDKGFLKGPDLTLALQVPVGRYRLDFLIDDRLIVEIDGAAYHSSPEARERDAQRDAYFTSEGYQILRIPAKFPLYIPQEAIDRVRAAQATLKADNQRKARATRAALRPSRILSALSEGARQFGDGVCKMTTEITEEIEKQARLDRQRVEEETAATLKRIQDKLDADPELRKLYEQLEREFDRSGPA